MVEAGAFLVNWTAGGFAAEDQLNEKSNSFNQNCHQYS